MSSIIPTCYFPTQIYLIDDNADFLKKLQRGIDPSQATYQIRKNPIEALEEINSSSATPKYIKDLEPDEISSNGIDMLAQEIYNTGRYNEISTIIVDYDMPEMTGLEFCQKIKSPHIRKILLTGAADEKIAVKAFNEGIINHYVRKQDPDVFDTLETYISLCQHKYFQSQHRVLGEYALCAPMGSVIDKQIFQDFFYQFIKEKQILEYYLMKDIGSYICLQKDGRAGVLELFTNARLEFIDMDLGYWISKDTWQDVMTPRILDEIDRRQKVFYIDTFNDSKFPDVKDWHKYILPLHILEGGREAYYWSYMPDYDPLYIKRIATYQEFRKGLTNEDIGRVNV